MNAIAKEPVVCKMVENLIEETSVNYDKNKLILIDHAKPDLMDCSYWIDKQYPTYASFAYDKFKLIKGNRKTDLAHISSIGSTLNLTEILTPATVWKNKETGDLFVFDGQNRLSVCKKYGQPFRFYIVTKKPTPEALSAVSTNTKKWTLDQKLNSFVEFGCKGYILFNEFVKKTELNPHSALMFLNIGSSLKKISDLFNNGKLDEAFINKVNWKLKYKEFKEFNAMWELYATCALIKKQQIRVDRLIPAYRQIKFIENFNKEYLLQKIRINVDKCIAYTRESDLVKQLLSIYNSDLKRSSEEFLKY